MNENCGEDGKLLFSSSSLEKVDLLDYVPKGVIRLWFDILEI